MNVIDHFLSAAGKRRIELCRRVHSHKPWIIRVMVPKSRVYGEWTELSTSEYATEEVARKDFEARRPTFRVQSTNEPEVPMQRGKRVVQEMLQEKLK